MNREIYLTKKYFCQYDCPNKNKDITKELINNVIQEMDYDDIEDYYQVCLETILNQELEGFICDNCPLENFIHRLEEEKIIEE